MGERASNEMEKLSLQTTNIFPRDLLHRFTSDSYRQDLASGSEEIELNLGLSLGGRFGVDRRSSGRVGDTNSSLPESSLVSNPPPVGMEDDREGSSRKNAGKETGSSCSMEDMPCVFTQGDGPNGRVVEGILYKYGKGEQVKIMCICHGSFLSPGEFVKHAGGTDFVHPLKHIVVKTSSSFS